MKKCNTLYSSHKYQHSFAQWLQLHLMGWLGYPDVVFSFNIECSNCTFHGPWSLLLPRRAEPRPARGRYQWGSPSVPWSNEGFLGTTGRDPASPGFSVLAGLVLCFWSTPCSWTKEFKFLLRVASSFLKKTIVLKWLGLFFHSRTCVFLSLCFCNCLFYLRQFSDWKSKCSSEHERNPFFIRFPQWGSYMWESSLQTSHKTTQWTDWAWRDGCEWTAMWEIRR